MAQKTHTLEVRVGALNSVGTAMSRTDPGGLALIRESVDLALKHDFPLAAQRAYNNLIVSMAGLGALEAELRPIHEESVQHARRYGLRPDILIHRLCLDAFGDGDWDEALRHVEEGRGATIRSAERELLEAFMETARHGPERGRPLVDAPRRRLLGPHHVARRRPSKRPRPLRSCS